MNPNIKTSAPAHPGCFARAFTFTELLVVIMVFAMLAMVLMPALARAKPNAQRFQCFNNLRQITSAIIMYAHDNHDFFPPNPDDGNTVTGHNWCEGEVVTGAGAQEFNPDILANPSTCLVAPYLNGHVSLFRCTADPRMGLYQGTKRALLGTVVPAARTISMSGAVGSVCAQYYQAGSGHSGAPVFPVNGPWIAGSSLLNHHNAPWRTYGKTSDIVAPSPADLFVISEENLASINDACLSTSAGQGEWVDYPSTLHNKGCVLSFADGHAELHKWLGSSLLAPGAPAGFLVSTNDPDWLWLASHTSVLAP